MVLSGSIVTTLHTHPPPGPGNPATEPTVTPFSGDIREAPGMISQGYATKHGSM